MGIKGWLLIGAGALLTIATMLGLRRERNLCAENAERMIREVDNNEREKEIPTVEEMTDDVEKAFREMGLDKEADAKVNESQDPNSEMNRRLEERIQSNIRKIKES